MRNRIPDVRQATGVVVSTSSGLAVNVNGARLALAWPAGYIPTAGDIVSVDIVDGRGRITGPVIRGQRPLTGIAGTASGGLLPVTTDAGVVQCRYLDPAPSAGALVRLDWQATEPWVWPGSASPVTAPGSAEVTPGPPPPPSTGSGVLYAPALSSGTYLAGAGVWSGYYGTHVMQGAWGGESFRGAWFYGAKPSQLRGRTITKAMLRLGARRRVGSYNSSLSLLLYRHGSNTRPSGSPSFIAGPHAVTLGVNAPAQWVPIPVAWAQTIVDGGGGLGITGGSYGGVTGISEDPSSGQLALTWTV